MIAAHKITGTQANALGMAFLSQRRARFPGWVQKHSRILGKFSVLQAITTYDLVEPEAAQSGIDAERRQFLYVAARLLMPEMSAAQYAMTMDIVFAPDLEEEALLALVSLRGS